MPSRTIFPLSAYKTSALVTALTLTATLFASSVEAAFTKTDLISTVTNGNNHSVVLGYVDNNNPYLDVMAGETNTQNLVMLNNGDKTFTSATLPTTPTSTYANGVALGDVDNDTDLDIVVGNGSVVGGEANQIYLNDGNGNFTLGSGLPGDTDYTTSVALGDVNGDAYPDIVVGNTGGANRVYLNDSTNLGNFTLLDALPTNSNDTEAVALGYVNNDACLDIVAGNAGQANRLYINDCDKSGKFSTVISFGSDTGYTDAVAVADVNGDNRPDVITGNYNGTNCVYLNDPTMPGSIDTTCQEISADTEYTTSLAVSDIDDDGDNDVLVGNSHAPSLRLYKNDGTGHFAAAVNIESDDFLYTSDIKVGDMDLNGHKDIVVVSSNSVNRIYYNDGVSNNSSGGGGGGAFGLGLLSLLFVILLGRCLTNQRRIC